MNTFVIEEAGLTAAERAGLEQLLAQSGSASPTLTAIWRLMDVVWLALGCDERAPSDACLATFYAHPIWLLNGMFVEQDPLSRGHRAAIVAWLVGAAPARVLDYGGGYGSLARMAAAALPATQVAVYEPFPSQAALVRAACHPNLRYVDNPGAGYDCVLCIDVLEHLTDPLPVLTAMVAGLRSGGHLVVVNNFYPLIRCHLPGTFYLRYSFGIFAAALGLRRVERVHGSSAIVYRKLHRATSLGRLRVLEAGARALFPPLRGLHRVYRRLRGRPPGLV